MMSTLIRLNPLRWPYSLQQLREDEPSKSFSSSPSKAEYAHYDVYYFEDVVALVEPPPVNPATHRLEQRPPVEVDDVLTQQWELVELTEAEREAYYRQTHPPRWIEFSDALPVEVDQLLGAAQAISPRLALALGVGLGKAADGDSRVFLSAWQTARGLGLVPAELVAGLQALAVRFDLPAEFVAGLAGPQQEWAWPENPQRFDEWTGPDGSQWVWDQPRAADGTYLADDPETEVVESALQWLPVGGEP
jgi:hypothetical protein